MRGKIAYSKDPKLNGHMMLEFLSEDYKTLTDEEKVESFMGRWTKIIAPFSTYAGRFRVGTKATPQAAIDLRHVKDFYKRFVLKEEWTEHKFVACTDAIFNTLEAYSLKTMSKKSELYDEEQLPSQLAAVTVEKRRKRI